MVKSKGSLKTGLEGLDKEKHPLPEGVDYDEVRGLFVKPEVADPETVDLKWGEPDEEGLKKFLVEEKGFAIARVESGIQKLKKARGSGQQMRMDAFFKVTANPAAASALKLGAPAPAAGFKRKGDGKAGAAGAKGNAAKKAKK